MDSRIKFLEHELAEQEREMNQKQGPAQTPASTENVAALEQKIRELEAIVKGLTGEVLDLKSVTRRLSQQIEDSRGGSKIQAEPRKTETSERTGWPSPSERKAQVPGGRRTIAEDEGTPAPRPSPRDRPVTQPQTGSRVSGAGSRHVISSPTPAPEQIPVPEPEVPVDELKNGEFEYVMQPDGSILKRKKTVDKTVIVAGTGYNPSHISRSNAIRSDSDAVIEAVEDDVVMDDTKKRR